VARFKPHFVIVSVYSNDFSGDASDVPSRGRGDWGEGKYWLDRIIQTCGARASPYLVVPVPLRWHVLGRRTTRYYPGIISHILELKSSAFLDPTDDFISAHLELIIEWQKTGEGLGGCILFNDRIGDGNFSALGSQIWAASVGRRLILLLRKNGTLSWTLSDDRGSSGASSPASSALSRRYAFLPFVSAHLVAFARRYVRVHSFFSLPGGRVRCRGLELSGPALLPGLWFEYDLKGCSAGWSAALGC
jgi:hypothetical protein